MTPLKPYLIVVVREWILDNSMTPLVLVNVNIEGVKIPEGYSKNGKILINMSENPETDFQIANGLLTFNTRFQGNKINIELPLESVLSVLSKENKHGIGFYKGGSGELPINNQGEPPRPKPKLTLV